jgi:hypothetical protein
VASSHFSSYYYHSFPFHEYYNYYFYDADVDLTPAMRQAIAQQQTYTQAMRDEYFAIVIDKEKDRPKLTLR